MAADDKVSGWTAAPLGEGSQAALQSANAYFRRGAYEKAAELFAAALTEEPELGKPLALSCYGTSLVLSGRDPEKGIELCEQAVKAGFQFGEVHLNLGRALLHQGNKAAAVASFRKGLLAEPRNQKIREALAELGLRRAPAFRALPRSHFLNRVIGRVTWWLGFKGDLVEESSEEAPPQQGPP